MTKVLLSLPFTENLPLGPAEKNDRRHVMTFSIKSKVVYLTLPSLYNFIIIRHFSACTLLP